MIANRMRSVFAVTALVGALVAASVSVADAGERGRNHRAEHRGDRGHGYHRVENSRWDRQGDGRRNRPAEIDRTGRQDFSGSVSHGRRLGGFYGGAIEAYNVRGLGTYFSSDYWPSRLTEKVVLAPKAKIIDVEKEMDGNAFASTACAFEAGICIIRGGN